MKLSHELSLWQTGYLNVEFLEQGMILQGPCDCGIENMPSHGFQSGVLWHCYEGFTMGVCLLGDGRTSSPSKDSRTQLGGYPCPSPLSALVRIFKGEGYYLASKTVVDSGSRKPSIVLWGRPLGSI